MSRRGNGEGTVYRRADGRWEGAAYVLLPNGARARRRTYGRTRAEAADKLLVLQRASQQGIPASASSQTVGAYLAVWVEQVAGNKVRPATLRSYRMYVERHLVPGLGRKRLSRLSPADIRGFMAERRAAGLSPATVKQLHAILRSALAHAVREDLLPRNVARLVIAPAAGRHDVAPLSISEAQVLLKAAEGDRLKALWTVALAAGLRRGEAIGLRWCDLDLDVGVLRVRQTLQRVPGGLVVVPPKTERSRRSIALPGVASRALVEHRERMVVEAISRGEELDQSGWVFTTKKGTPLEPRNVNRSFVALLDNAGLRRIRLHDLRHTCATLLLVQGVAPRVVMDTLGHSAIAVTMNTYSHVMPVMQREAASRMDDVLGG